MKKVKDLKIGDICYLVSDEGRTENVKVTDIKEITYGRIEIEYDNCVKSFAYGFSYYTQFGLYNKVVFLTKEDAIQYLEDKIKDIDREIEKLKKQE